jgi:hypothetical protein
VRVVLVEEVRELMLVLLEVQMAEIILVVVAAVREEALQVVAQVVAEDLVLSLSNMLHQLRLKLHTHLEVQILGHVPKVSHLLIIL